MLERDATKRLSGRIEIDDAYLGGERSGGARPRDAVRRRCRDHRRGKAGSPEAAPGHQRRRGGRAHQVVKTGSGPSVARTPASKWVNTALGNIKAAITGTYRAINSKHVPRYRAEFDKTLVLAIELSNTSWVLTAQVPAYRGSRRNKPSRRQPRRCCRPSRANITEPGRPAEMLMDDRHLRGPLGGPLAGTLADSTRAGWVCGNTILSDGTLGVPLPPHAHPDSILPIRLFRLRP